DLFICRRILEEIFQIWKDKRYINRRIRDSTINEGTYLRDFDFIIKMTIRNVDENLKLDWAEKTSVSSEFRKTSNEESNNQIDKKRSYRKKPDATAVFSLNSKYSELFYLEGSGPPFIHDVQKWEKDCRKGIRLCNDSKNYIIAKFLDSFQNISINHIKEIMEIPVICYQFYGTQDLKRTCLKVLYFDQPLAYAPLIPIGRIFCIDEIDIPIEPVESDEIINLIELIFKIRGILKSSVDKTKDLIRELKNTKINRTKLRT
ncbi:38545_t:CDS:2, partial [Gigaspora margarita]